MSDIFNSEMIREGVSEISSIQRKLLKNSSNEQVFTSDNKYEQLKLLKELLEKQKLMYTRFSLMEDPEAKIMLEKMTTAAQISNNSSLYEFFAELDKKINFLENALDNLE